jgi:hypothetical protein
MGCGRLQRSSGRRATTTRLVLMFLASLVVIVNLVLQHRRTIRMGEVQQQAASAMIVGVITSLSSSSSSSSAAAAANDLPASANGKTAAARNGTDIRRSDPTTITTNTTITTTNTTTHVTVTVRKGDVPSLSSFDAGANLTENLPSWLVSYVDWHRRTKPTITEDNWDQHKYLVLRCLSWFPFCSGTSDRLRTFLFLLYLAQSDPDDAPRVFLIHWSRPAPLEAFLVPPDGGLDWRVPDWLLPKLELGNESHWRDVPWDEGSLLQDYRIKAYYRVVEFSFIFQLHRLVDQLEKQYRDCFRALFQPVPEIRQIVDTTQSDLGLADRPYTSVHLRMKYTSVDRDEDTVWRALLCAAKIGHPEAPIFVASDSGEMAAWAARIAAERGLNRTVVARNDYHLHPSLHMDMGSDFFNPRSDDWRNHNASEYYTVFSDLLLLGDASCVVAGTGSYGKWGSQLSRNVSCFGNYMTGEGC